MLTQVLPAVTAEEAVLVFTELVRSHVPHDPNDAYFAHNWERLWLALAEGGWTACADGDAPGQAGDFSLLDLTHLAEIWGGFVIPLPLVPTLAVRRWLAVRPAAELPLSWLSPEQAGSVAPHAETAAALLAGSRLVPRSEFPGGELDGFAASLPITVLAGTPAFAAARHDAALLGTAEAVGAAAEALRRAVDYVKLREQFGKPVGSFQGLKHRLADLHCRLELARSAIVWATAEPGELAPACHAALEHALRIAEGCVQAHGGIGFTWEASIHRFYRHIMAWRRVVVAALA